MTKASLIRSGSARAMFPDRNIGGSLCATSCRARTRRMAAAVVVATKLALLKDPAIKALIDAAIAEATTAL
jgi:hypothetical protein